jgi:hypothetical protein
MIKKTTFQQTFNIENLALKVNPKITPESHGFKQTVKFH